MTDNHDNINELPEEVETCVLVDEDGNESVFELIGELEIDGAEYLAFMPIESDDCEYVILKKERDENGEETLVTIDDDDEFERVAEEFEDRLMDELDLDELDGDNEDDD
ncbi:MAG: DUF1292 domain-containing protein [Clostridia bacterium]|nr:DUF1292 domain-containing protein [Clostridia bacterium]